MQFLQRKTAAALLLCATPFATASDFSLTGSWQLWQQSYSGDVNSAASNITIDLENDLQYDDERSNVFYAAIEHPLPVLPNFKVQRTEMEVSRSGTLRREIEFDEKTFAADSSFSSTLNLSHTDITAYWQPMQNWLTIGLGFTIRLYDSRITIQSRTTPSLRANEEVEQKLPMAYAKASLQIPNTRFSVGAELQGLGYDGSSLIDAQLQVAYESIFGFGAVLGYRSFQLKLDDIDDLDADISVTGAYLGATYHF